MNNRLDSVQKCVKEMLKETDVIEYERTKVIFNSIYYKPLEKKIFSFKQKLEATKKDKLNTLKTEALNLLKEINEIYICFIATPLEKENDIIRYTYLGRNEKWHY
jgi:hypothetical protein